MPDISQMKNSKFLAQGDVKERPLLLTMTTVSQENVAKEGVEPEMKWCLHFEESDKPLVLNQINMQLIAQITGSTNSDNWAGKKVVLFNDPTVSFGGKLTGGIRVRAPKNQAKPAAVAAPAAVPDAVTTEDEDSAPF